MNAEDRESPFAAYAEMFDEIGESMTPTAAERVFLVASRAFHATGSAAGLAALAILLVGCATTAPTEDYRTPPDPGQLWIWPTRDEASAWQRDNPTIRLCIAEVPDGFTTARC